MSEVNKPTTRVPRFLSKERLRREAKSAVVIAVILGVGYYFLWHAINPSHINHLVVVQESPILGEYPVQLTLETKDGVLWVIALESHGSALLKDNPVRVSVANIAEAWFPGKLTLRDNHGNIMADVKCEPPRRYCGACVIYIRRDGTASIGWNQLFLKDDVMATDDEME